MKVTPAIKRNAVARVMGAEKKGEQIAAEAQRLNVASRTIERWVEAAQAAAAPPPSVEGNAGQDVVSEKVVPPGETSGNPVLDSLLKKEGAGPEAGPTAPTPGEVAGAQVDIANFCVDALNGFKTQVGTMAILWQFNDYIDPTSPEVLRLLKFAPITELCIRSNAPKLYPVLVKHSGTWSALAMAIGMDAFGSMMAVQTMAKRKGWTPTPKAKKDDPPSVKAASVPSTQSYAESLNPAAAAPPPPAPPPSSMPIVDGPTSAPEAA